MRSFEANLINKISNYQERDPQNYWKMVDELRKLEQRNINDAEKIDPDVWLHHYKNLLWVNNINVRDDELKESLNKIESEEFFSELDYEITNKEIESAVKTLKNNKATGLDGNSNEIIKNIFLPSSQFIIKCLI